MTCKHRWEPNAFIKSLFPEIKRYQCTRCNKVISTRLNQTTYQNCKHCYGIVGYDASGYACTCIKESP